MTNPAETFNTVRERLKGQHGALHVWFVLLGFLHVGQGRSYCFPGQRTLAERVGCDLKSVRPWLEELKRKSCITEEAYHAVAHDDSIPSLYTGRAVYTLLGEGGEPWYGPQTGPPWWGKEKSVTPTNKNAATPPQSSKLEEKRQSGKTVVENHHTPSPKTTTPKTNNSGRGKTTTPHPLKPPHTVVDSNCGGFPPQKYMQSKKYNKGEGNALSESGGGPVESPYFEPLPPHLFPRELKDKAERARVRIKKIKDAEANYQRVLRKDVADLVEMLEAEAKAGKQTEEKLQRVKKLKADADNWKRGAMKTECAQELLAWSLRLEEIENRIDGVRR